MRRGLWLGSTLLLACSTGSGDRASEDVPTSSTASAIVNGTFDTTHTAVVTVISDGAGDTLDICTGTIVKSDPASGTGWVATAAHCINDGAARVVLEGSDYAGQDRVRHSVLGSVADSRFDINHPENGYDFAVVRISGVTAATPVIPLASAPDQVTIGQAMDNIGFGRINRPPEEAVQNSKRHIVSTKIATTTELLLAYDSATAGACQGDSGGPWLVGSGESQRVVGIDSYGNTTCDGLAVAGRVQAGLDFFNAELGLAVPEKCELCRTLATSSGGKCTSAESSALATCVCTKACTDECSATTECTGLPSATTDPDTTTNDATATDSDAGAPSNVLVVHKAGSGCSSAPGQPGRVGQYGVWLLAGVALLARRARRIRLRPYRS